MPNAELNGASFSVAVDRLVEQSFGICPVTGQIQRLQPENSNIRRIELLRRQAVQILQSFLAFPP